MEARLKRSFYLWLLILTIVFIQTVAGRGQTNRMPAEIIGKWHNGSVSMLTEVDLTKGTQTPSNGSTFTYTFSPNNRFSFVGMIASTMYGCTTTLFNHKTGTVSVNGSQMTFSPDKNYWKNVYSCSPRSNKERNYILEDETYEWRIKTDEYGRNLICLTDAKGAESCYREEKE